MEREIKFRGKHIHDYSVLSGEWVYGDLLHTNDGLPHIHQIETDSYFEIISATVGQYTGLKDKNGDSIYEGDVLQMWIEDAVEPAGGYFHQMYVVFTVEKGFALWGHNMTIEDAETLYDTLQWTNCEIIGNIYPR